MQDQSLKLEINNCVKLVKLEIDMWWSWKFCFIAETQSNIIDQYSQPIKHITDVNTEMG